MVAYGNRGLSYQPAFDFIVVFPYWSKLLLVLLLSSKNKTLQAYFPARSTCVCVCMCVCLSGYGILDFCGALSCASHI